MITPLGGPAQAFSVAVQSDGKIVAAGFAHLVSGDFDFALTRYNSNGTLDTTFGTGGKKTTAFGAPSVAQGNAVAIQQDGKIVVAGLTIVNNIANFRDGPLQQQWHTRYHVREWLQKGDRLRRG